MKMLESKIKIKELGKVISWRSIEVTISDGVVTELKGNLTGLDIDQDPDGLIAFSQGIKNLIKSQQPRKVRKDKNIPRKGTILAGSDKKIS